MTQGGRLGAAQSFYFDICADMFERLQVERCRHATLLARIAGEEAAGNEYPSSVTEEREAHRGCLALAVEIIVFANMCLEAAAYDYAAWHLGDAFTSAHLDRLDLIGKWTIIPRLIARNDVELAPATYELERGLVRRRNALVHHKSRSMLWGAEELAKFAVAADKRERDTIFGAQGALKAVILLSLDLDRTMGGRTVNPLPAFGRDAPRHGPERHPSLGPLIDRCRLIDLRMRRKAGDPNRVDAGKRTSIAL